MILQHRSKKYIHSIGCDRRTDTIINNFHFSFDIQLSGWSSLVMTSVSYTSNMMVLVTELPSEGRQFEPGTGHCFCFSIALFFFFFFFSYAPLSISLCTIAHPILDHHYHSLCLMTLLHTGVIICDDHHMSTYRFGA